MLVILTYQATSCSPTYNQQEFLIPSPTSTLSVIPFITATNVESQTSTPTSTPYTPTLTPRPNFQATLQASSLDNVEQLSNDERNRLFDLYLESDNPVCPLPCWNGVTPGNSDILELPEFFGRLGFDQFDIVEYGSDRVAWAVSDDLNRAEWGREFYLEIGAEWVEGSDEVSVIRLITIGSPTRFDLGSLLRELGFAEIVLMEEQGQGTRIQLLLAYPDRGISITLIVSTDNTGTMLCPKNPFINMIYVVFVDSTLNVIEETIPMDFPQDTSYYSSMNQNEVLEFLSHSRCIPLTWERK